MHHKLYLISYFFLFNYAEQMQLSFLTICIILNLKSIKFTIRILFSRFGSPKAVLITSNASIVPKIPGVTPITGKGPSSDDVPIGSEKTH